MKCTVHANPDRQTHHALPPPHPLNTPLDIALIGVGGVGQIHLAAIASLTQEGRARLVAVADPSVDRLPEAKAALTAQGVRWYRRYEELLDEEKTLDVVTIATPIPYHFEMARACIRRGLFVNLEKPPVPCLHQLETLIEDDRAQRVSVGFQMIGSPPVQQLKQLAMAGEFGEIREIRAAGCWPRSDAYYERASWAGKMHLGGEPVFDGPATNALAHVLHSIMYLAGQEAGSFEVPVSVQGELYRARPIQSYDVACLRGRLRSGALFAVALTHATEREFPFQIEVHGDRGWARLSANGTRLETSGGLCMDDPESFADGFARYYRRFFEGAVENGQRADTRLGDARGYVVATNAMLLSSGGVHTIGKPWACTYGEGANGGYAVTGLHETMKAFLATGKLFSELSVPWAVATGPIDAEGISAERCARWLRASDADADAMAP